MTVIPFPKACRMPPPVASQAVGGSVLAADYAAARQRIRARAQANEQRIARARAVLRLCAAAQFGAGLAMFYILAARHAFMLEVFAAGTLAFAASAVTFSKAEKL